MQVVTLEPRTQNNAKMHIEFLPNASDQEDKNYIRHSMETFVFMIKDRNRTTCEFCLVQSILLISNVFGHHRNNPERTPLNALLTANV